MSTDAQCYYTRGNRSTWRKPARLGKVRLHNIYLTRDQGNFNQVTTWSRNRTLVTVVTDTCTTTVPPAPLMSPVPFTNSLLTSFVWSLRDNVCPQFFCTEIAPS